MIKFQAKKKKIILKRHFHTKKETRNFASGRTKKEAAILRDKCMMFLMFAGLKEGGMKELKNLGYDDYHHDCFIVKHGVSKNYVWELQMRNDFKEKFFAMVTAYMAKDLMSYMRALCYSKEASKAMQILFPDEVGKAMAVRNISMTGTKDDEEFRNNFFLRKKPKLKKKVKV